jgi:hypothetical protein
LGTRLVDRVAIALAAHTNRRGFLQRSAIVGSALAVNPVTFVLRPISAYAAACQCRGQPCSCGTACCDGYTEFCCTLTGANSCPGGTVPGGWWKADGTSFCGGGPRYYMDCNVAPGANPCSCSCALDDCNHRVQCCTFFRYGQCHQELSQVGAIMCRLVTCTPPWVIDGTCTTTSATDQATAAHDAPCLHQPPPPPPPPPPTPRSWQLRLTPSAGPPELVVTYGISSYRFLTGDWNGDGVDGIGTWDPATATFYLRDTNTPGPPDHTINYGTSNYIPLVGDWNGNGTDTIGTWDPATATFYLRDTNTPGPPDRRVHYGTPGDRPVVGDFGGLGLDGVGVITPEAPAPPAAHTTTWNLREANGPGPPDRSFDYGNSGYRFVSGDWTGSGADGVGTWDPANGTFYLRSTASPGAPQLTVQFGAGGETPVVGDWDGDGHVTVGVFIDGQWRLRNSNTPGPAELSFAFGSPGDLPVVGDWNGDGKDGIGVWTPSTGMFALRNTASPGSPDITVWYGTAGYVPLAGDWTASGKDGIGMWDGANANFYLRSTPTPGPPEITVHYGTNGNVPVVGDWNGDGKVTVGVVV